MDSLIIVIAGIKRSASTGQYNMTRLILEDAGYQVNIFGQSHTPRRLSPGQVDLVKIHPFNKKIAEAADHIFLTDRNDWDILKSLERMWGSGNLERLISMKKQLNLWREYTTDRHQFNFYEIANFPERCMIEIIQILKLSATVNLEKVYKEFRQIEVPKEQQDPVSLLFPNHINLNR